MDIDSMRLTLKQHRFEIGAAAILSIVMGTAALWVAWRLHGFGVSSDCVAAWLADPPAGAGCGSNVEAFLALQSGEASMIFAGMTIVPFAVGLLGGVPIVGRELEAGTAQIAWSVSASRPRWLIRQVVPIVIVLGAAVTFAAFASELLVESRRGTLPSTPFDQLGLHGPLVMARALAALGIGLFAGAVVGRTLPAFIVGAVLSVAVVIAAGATRDMWVSNQTLSVVDQSDFETFDGIVVTQGWRDTNGAIFSYADASALASVHNPDVPEAWLIQHGYEPIGLGLANEVATNWEPIEIAGSGVLGIVLMVGTILVVERQCPA